MTAPAPASATAFGSATPPAVFPPILGLFGLGLAWRQAAVTLRLPGAIGELILGAVTLLYLFAALSYAVKLARRPGVLPEDMRVLPGRGGVGAALMALCLLAAALVPYSSGLARAVVLTAVVLQAGLILLFLRLLVSWPAEQRRVTPVQHILLVGMICAPLALVPLGLTGLATAIFALTGLAAAAIWGASLAQLIRGAVPPPPLRPAMAIHLAPAALLATVALKLGYQGLALGLAIWSIAILVALLGSWRELTATGFSAMWGSFTFPLAAFSGMMLGLGSAMGLPAARWIGAVALTGASVLIPWIAYRVMQAWAKGGLATATNAARA